VPEPERNGEFCALSTVRFSASQTANFLLAKKPHSDQLRQFANCFLCGSQTKSHQIQVVGWFDCPEQYATGEPLTSDSIAKAQKMKTENKRFSLLDLPMCVILFQDVAEIVTMEILKARSASTPGGAQDAPVHGSYFSACSLIRARMRIAVPNQTQPSSLPRINCRPDKFFRIVNHVSRPG